MKKRILYLLAIAVVAVTGCQKELSLENGNTPAKGSLQDDALGDCLPKTVNGTYSVGTPLVATTNTITVDVNVTRAGSYTIGTDTINGCFFRGTGIFTATGNNTVTLRGNGTPFAAGIFNFTVAFDSTFCDVQVDFTSPGVGTLAGAPNACAPITVNGGYSPGVALTAGNNAQIQVNVTTAGGFNITTDTVQGLWFSFAGNIAATGNQPVILQAQGSTTALTTGSKTFTVKLGSSRCTFVVTVAAPAVGTVNCGGATFAGTFTAGTAMTAANTVQIGITITTAGVYSITTDTVNGVWFNASGTFANTTPTTIILTGNGTPTNSGSFIYTVKWGTSTCTFSCTYGAPLSTDYFPRTTNSNWSYEFDNVSDDSLYRTVIAPTITASGNAFNIFMEDDGLGLDSSGYYRKSGGDYFQWLNGEDVFLFDNPLWLQYIILKDNVAVNTTWVSGSFSGSVGGTPITFRISSRIKQKDVPVTINTSINPGGITYQNVIVVEETYEVELLPGNWQAIAKSENYYARGIGLIKLEVFDTGGTSQALQELRRYQIF